MRRVLTGLGIALCRLDGAVSSILGRRSPLRLGEGLDKTGRMVDAPQRPTVQRYPQDVLLVDYPGQLAHSLWRSQELSLLARYRRYLVRPRLDFGCGDGSFSSALLEQVDFGIDHDLEALRMARGYGIYRGLVCKDHATSPLRDRSVGSVFSNSVLEHVDDLDENVAGLHDALVPGGYFVFTVPVATFAAHLGRYFGRRESERVNQSWYHRNLHPSDWWRDLLARHGFEVRHVHPYQPDWFTVSYFALCTRPARLLQRRGLGERPRVRRVMARMVAASITGTTEGGNILVVAQRRQ